jgi:hypothetical protein
MIKNAIIQEERVSKKSQPKSNYKPTPPAQNISFVSEKSIILKNKEETEAVMEKLMNRIVAKLNPADEKLNSKIERIFNVEVF